MARSFKPYGRFFILALAFLTSLPVPGWSSGHAAYEAAPGQFYYKRSSNGVELEPQDLVLVAHGGKSEYIKSWVQGEGPGYGLEYPKGAPWNSDPSQLPGVGIQVHPLCVFKEGQAVPLATRGMEGIAERTGGYAHRTYTNKPFTTSAALPTQEERDRQHEELARQTPAVLYMILPAQHVQSAYNAHEAGVRDEARPFIKGFYLKTCYEPCYKIALQKIWQQQPALETFFKDLYYPDLKMRAVEQIPDQKDIQALNTLKPLHKAFE